MYLFNLNRILYLLRVSHVAYIFLLRLDTWGSFVNYSWSVTTFVNSLSLSNARVLLGYSILDTTKGQMSTSSMSWLSNLFNGFRYRDSRRPVSNLGSFRSGSRSLLRLGDRVDSCRLRTLREDRQPVEVILVV